MSQDTTQDESDALEAWENSGGADRDMSEPAEQSGTDDSPELQAAIRDAYAAVEAGEVPSNYSARDAHFAAVLRGWKAAGELGEVVEDANRALDRDHNEAAVSLSKAVELLVRVGATELRPDILDVARDAKTEYEVEKIDTDDI